MAIFVKLTSGLIFNVDEIEAVVIKPAPRVYMRGTAGKDAWYNLTEEDYRELKRNL